MPRRRTLSPSTKTAALDQAWQMREACIEIRRSSPIGGPEYLAVGQVLEAIDGLAEALTGDRQRFWNRSHGAGV